jgi:class I fructose-bisphosphate aldolase
MNLGKQIRLNRLFAHPSGRLFTVAIDHFGGCQTGLPEGLTNLGETLEKVMAGRPDAVTMLKGPARKLWPDYAGQLPLIVSSVHFRVDDSYIENVVHPEEVALMGADAIAVAIGVRGAKEGRFMKILCDIVEGAERVNLPVIAHIYPRDYSGDEPKIVHDPENIMWAVRCGIESGVDVVKVPFTGDAASFRDIIATSPVPVVAAGGPATPTFEDALRAAAQVVESGARGATIGRNVWGTPSVTENVLALKAIIHGDKSLEQVLSERADLSADAS